MNAILLLALLLQTATIADTIRTADGSLAQGRIELTNTAFTTSAAQAVAPGYRNVALTNGAFSINLFPNVGGTPESAYTARYYLTNGARHTESWRFTTGTWTVPAIQAAPFNSQFWVINQNQLILGTGMTGLLGLARFGTGMQPAATAAAQCYFDSTAAQLKCSDTTNAYRLVPHFITATATLDFSNATICEDQSVAIAGTLEGQPCTLGVLPTVYLQATILLTCFVSPAGTVRIRLCSVTGSPPALDPPSALYRIQVQVP